MRGGCSANPTRWLAGRRGRTLSKVGKVQAERRSGGAFAVAGGRMEEEGLAWIMTEVLCLSWGRWRGPGEVQVGVDLALWGWAG